MSIESLYLSLPLCLAGTSTFIVPMTMDAIDPWRTPVTSAVEAVEPRSLLLLFHKSWFVHDYVVLIS